MCVFVIVHVCVRMHIDVCVCSCMCIRTAVTSPGLAREDWKIVRALAEVSCSHTIARYHFNILFNSAVRTSGCDHSIVYNAH